MLEINTQEINPTVGEQETTQPVEETPTQTDSAVAEENTAEETFTKAQVIEMMRRRVERSHQSFYKRFNVKDLDEMDAQFGKIAEYEKTIAENGAKYDALVEEIAFLRNNIDPAKYEDIKTFFKGLDKKVNSDDLVELLKTHPEWLKQPVVQEEPKPTTTFQTLTPERGHTVAEDDDAKRKRIFGL